MKMIPTADPLYTSIAIPTPYLKEEDYRGVIIGSRFHPIPGIYLSSPGYSPEAKDVWTLPE